MPSNNNVNSIRSRMAGISLENTRPAVAPPKDDDGWQKVQNSHPRTAERTTQRSTYGSRQSPPSGAALSRRAVYETPTKQNSHYKQSLLPIGDQNPALAQIEQNRGQKYRKSEFYPGMIVRGVVHEQDYMGTSTGSSVTVMDRNRTESRYGPICTKYRKMIVLSLFEDHYLAIPLFTHNGKGLQNKSKPAEFVSVQDHRNKKEVPWQSSHRPLMTEQINEGIDLFDEKSTAHITYGLPRKYDLPVIKEGRLLKKSVNRLIALYKLYAPEQLKDQNGQIIQ
ncbi:MAG: hypothetical protein Q9219_000934 [cf. Caloplaca sp. 3 TL-2023]